jgi:hypothetical protein
MHTTSADFTNCLKCNGPIHVAAMFAVEVTNIEGKLKGYLHVQDCRATWEKENPGFVYGSPTPPPLCLKFIAETWSSEGYVEKCCVRAAVTQ